MSAPARQTFEILLPERSAAGPLAGLVVIRRLHRDPLQPRPKLAADAQHLSAKVADTVSTHTNVLVAGNKTGSKKARAEVLGLPVLDDRRGRLARAHRQGRPLTRTRFTEFTFCGLFLFTRQHPYKISTSPSLWSPQRRATWSARSFLIALQKSLQDNSIAQPGALWDDGENPMPPFHAPYDGGCSGNDGPRAVQWPDGNRHLYGPAEVARLRGSIPIKRTMARRGAERLRRLLKERPFV